MKTTAAKLFIAAITTAIPLLLSAHPCDHTTIEVGNDTNSRIIIDGVAVEKGQILKNFQQKTIKSGDVAKMEVAQKGIFHDVAAKGKIYLDRDRGYLKYRLSSHGSPNTCYMDGSTAEGQITATVTYNNDFKTLTYVITSVGATSAK